MAKNDLDAVVKVEITNVEIVKLVANHLGVEVINKEEFARRVNESIVSFIIPRLLTKQMEIDGVIAKRDE